LRDVEGAEAAVAESQKAAKAAEDAKNGNYLSWDAMLLQISAATELPKEVSTFPFSINPFSSTPKK